LFKFLIFLLLVFLGILIYIPYKAGKFFSGIFNSDKTNTKNNSSKYSNTKYSNSNYHTSKEKHTSISAEDIIEAKFEEIDPDQNNESEKSEK